MVRYFILFLVLLLCVISDLRVSKIRNVYAAAAIVAGTMISTILNGTEGLTESAVGIMLPVLLLGFFFYAKLVGAGDIKLFCGIGALFGGEFVLFAMAYSFFLCGIFAFLTLLIKGEIVGIFNSFSQEIKECIFTQSISVFENKKARTIIRMSPAIAAGCTVQVLMNLL